MITDNLKIPIVRMFFLLFYITFMLTHFYTYCYSAEKLMAESTNMAYGVYECKWYGIPSKNAKDLMLIVYRSRIPLKLTAGKFGIVSLELFGIAIKTAMGYLSALITLQN
ncbi:PREDICTED: putative odorant receptor 19b [Trachymyrmex septentrionalis]|uniref:putative odorant receptor 19b n=1 Tax=Trachymyrmex septentrionalis TaxID=34720 RepID=UPI00084F74E9|nr:PREDICTED: putative odorant receptor 19b [Trachymyrmex septentrionalis]